MRSIALPALLTLLMFTTIACEMPAESAKWDHHTEGVVTTEIGLTPGFKLVDIDEGREDKSIFVLVRPMLGGEVPDTVEYAEYGSTTSPGRYVIKESRGDGATVPDEYNTEKTDGNTTRVRVRPGYKMIDIDRTSSDSVVRIFDRPMGAGELPEHYWYYQIGGRSGSRYLIEERPVNAPAAETPKEPTTAPATPEKTP